MTLLNIFKELAGNSKSDSFNISIYLQKALDKCASVVSNKKYTSVNLQSNVFEYDLSDVSVASPAVSVGIQQISVDSMFPTGYVYNDEFWFSTPTTLNFTNDRALYNGKFEFNYYSFFTLPTLVGETYTETDAPTRLFGAIANYASVLSQLDELASGDKAEKIREANMETTYGNISSQKSNLLKKLDDAVSEMKLQGGGRGLMFTRQII